MHVSTTARGADELVERVRRGPLGQIEVDLTQGDAAPAAVRELSGSELVDEHGWSELELAEASGYEVTTRQRVAAALGLLPTDEISVGGVGYGATGRGLDLSKEDKPIYYPLSARGSLSSHGLYEALWRGEIQIQRPWDDVKSALIAGDWYVDPPQGSGLLGEEQAVWIEHALMTIQGGWDAFLVNALHSLITGFALFETVYDAETLAIDRFAFRHSRQVREWIVDRAETRLVGVRLGSPGRSDVVLPAHHVMLISHNAFGLDFEGNSPLRPIAKYAAAKEILDRLQILGYEKYATLILTILEGPGLPLQDSQRLVDDLRDMTGEDLVVITMPDGRSLDVVSPAGQMPDFGPAREYCDLQISLALRGEGSSIGQRGHGSFALAEVVDGKRLGSVPGYARTICAAINGSRGVSWTGPIRKMIDARWGPPADGRYPELRYAVDRQARGQMWLDDVIKAVSAGLLPLTTELTLKIAEHLGVEI